MATYNIDFFGWCHTEGHDKVWGWISISEGSKRVNFWGTRGKRYTFKRYQPPASQTGWGLWAPDELETLCRSKMRPGRRTGTYEEIAPADVARIVPNFADEFERQLTLALLFDNFHGETEKADD
jgi:hypothetical protein